MPRRTCPAVAPRPRDTLQERAPIATSPESFAEFQRRLDAPPQPNARLRKAMQAPAPWAKKA